MDYTNRGDCAFSISLSMDADSEEMKEVRRQHREHCKAAGMTEHDVVEMARTAPQRTESEVERRLWKIQKQSS